MATTTRRTTGDSPLPGPARPIVVPEVRDDHGSVLLCEKAFPDGERRTIYLVFLLYECRVSSSRPTIHEEFSEYAWAPPAELVAYDLNPATRDTFAALGLLPSS